MPFLFYDFVWAGVDVERYTPVNLWGILPKKYVIFQGKKK